MSGPVPNTSHKSTHLHAQKPSEAGTVIIPILQVEKERQSKVRYLAWGHMVCEAGIWT